MSQTVATNPFAPMSDALAANYDVVGAAVRERDHDRWLASLWAPAERRRHLLVLTAFSGEIARIRDVVSDPLPGEMRVRWWADVLEGARGAEGEGHPIAACLLDTVRRFGLPREPLGRLIEARIFDLYDDPMANRAELETYLDDTVGTLFDLGARVLAGEAAAAVGPVATAAGHAYGLTGLLRALPFHASRGQIYLPADLLDAHGVAREDILAGRSSPALLAALAEVRGLARAALAETRRQIRSVPFAAVPAFLPLSLLDLWLDRMERADYDPFHTSVEPAPWRGLWRLWRSARRARGAAKRRGEILDALA